jgi:hypothetical protein
MAEIRSIGDVVEIATVGHERISEIRPRDVGRRAGEPQRSALRGLPCGEASVGKHHAVAKRGERHRHAAAVGASRRPDPLGVDEALVDQERDQLLRVANLVAGVHQA